MNKKIKSNKDKRRTKELEEIENDWISIQSNIQRGGISRIIVLGIDNDNNPKIEVKENNYE